LPQDTLLSQDEIESYRAYVGRRMQERDTVSPRAVRRFAAALDQEWALANGELPPMWHWSWFLNQTPTARLGADGHPPRGDFMPPVKLPRRMFAGAAMNFHAPLRAGVEATRVSEIASVDYRQGKSGGLVFVRVKAAMSQHAKLCIEEEQTIVYRGDGPRLPPIVPRAFAPASNGETTEVWTPSSVELFRFSAVTFNAHRIHYDLPYAADIEGYPGLVVHGPLTACRLCHFAARVAGPLTAFQFRGEAPLFAGQPVRLVATRDGTECQVKAIRCDGAVTMSAVARS